MESSVKDISATQHISKESDNKLLRTSLNIEPARRKIEAVNRPPPYRKPTAAQPAEYKGKVTTKYVYKENHKLEECWNTLQNSYSPLQSKL